MLPLATHHPWGALRACARYSESQDRSALDASLCCWLLTPQIPALLCWHILVAVFCPAAPEPGTEWLFQDLLDGDVSLGGHTVHDEHVIGTRLTSGDGISGLWVQVRVKSGYLGHLQDQWSQFPAAGVYGSHLGCANDEVICPIDCSK